MLFLMESGYNKEYSYEDAINIYKAKNSGNSPVIKIKSVDMKFQQDMQLRVGSIALMVKNGSLGELKRELEKYIRISPNGPSASFDVLQHALDARNYLCHEFFKEIGEGLENDRVSTQVIAKLEEIQAALQAAISFSDQIASTLRQQFPRSFADRCKAIH